MNVKCLHREIKIDGRGLFVYFGGYRLRPRNPRTTKFRLNEEIALDYDFYRIADEGAKVFKENSYSELWKSRPKRPR